MSNLFGRNPNVNRPEYFDLVDWPVDLTPLVEFQPCCFGRYVVNSADEREACIRD